MNNTITYDNLVVTYLTHKKDIVRIEIEDNANPLIVNSPNNILSFQCFNDSDIEKLRKDELKLELPHLVKSLGKWSTVKISYLYGPSKAILNSNNHSRIEIERITPNEKVVLFNYPCLLFYSRGVKANLSLSNQKITDLLLTKNFDILHTSITGEGIIGFCGEGEIFEYTIPEGEVIFINQSSLIGYKCPVDRSEELNLRTYGNWRAAQNMDFHYCFRGPMTVLLQSQNLVNDLKNIEKNNKLVEYIKKVIDKVSPIPI